MKEKARAPSDARVPRRLARHAGASTRHALSLSSVARFMGFPGVRVKKRLAEIEAMRALSIGADLP